MASCKGCGKRFNPVEAMMGPLCGLCVREAHREAVGDMSREQVEEARRKRMGRPKP